MNYAGLSVTRIPYKNYGSSCLRIRRNGNKRIVILIPGMTLPGDAFFNIPVLSNGQTIADQIINAGYDVAFFDPIGFGDSRGLVSELCLRDKLAEQLIDSITILEPEYSKIYLQGFCTTHHVPLIAATIKKSVAGVIVMSPYRNYPLHGTFDDYFCKYQQFRNNFHQANFFINFNVDSLSTRLQDADNAVCQKNNNTITAIKLTNWKDLINDCTKKFKRFKFINGWLAVRDMLHDPILYPNLNNGLQGWDIKDINCPISVLRGEFDFEFIFGDGHLTIDHVKPNLVSDIEVKGASHFGMWDIVRDEWTNKFIESLEKLG